MTFIRVCSFFIVFDAIVNILDLLHNIKFTIHYLDLLGDQLGLFILGFGIMTKILVFKED